MGLFSKLFTAFKKFDDELFDELEEAMIAADMGVEAAMEMTERLRAEAKARKTPDADALRELLVELIAEELQYDEPVRLETKPSVVLVVGVNGVGKTTTIGKLAAKFAHEGKSVLLGAADTFRAAAADQLEIWAKRTGAAIVRHKEGSDPAAVVFDAIAAGRSRGVDIIICDTAGRLHNKKNLMNELSKICRVVERELPGCDREILLVIDATTGQNGLLQAKEFAGAANVSGVVLTKFDGTAKGGIVVAIRRELSLPVRYIGVGEGAGDLKEFDPHAFAEELV
ncbi:Signal recognition particle receptor FtsY [bioreactor metagenome]|uniref:Signal recognition particle receptor FtsY n=1 Tax=bioreactor metagenome TaxID=1076179 RepID=A0A644X4T3_9ZZZZ